MAERIENWIIQQTLKTGKREGLKEGEQKLKKREIEIAKSMLADSEPIEKIVKHTGLSKRVIKGLGKSLSG